MARVKGAMMTRKRRNKTLKLAKSYWGSKSRHFKMAKEALFKSGVYAYIGRKQKKRNFRTLWIARISAAVAPFDLNYSRFMSISRREAPGLISSAFAISSSVVSPCADSTTHTSFPA